MAERPVAQLTLRELFTNAERLAREIIEHLEQGFIPKIHNLDRLVRAQEEGADEVLDVTVRNTAAAALSSDEFSQKLLARMNEYLVAIDNAIERQVNHS